ncbi:AAA family ATPase [Gilvimarinus sp. SDUM040013]|nr:AAA family ATPase [Gilvimarinus sp. SDUM040013]MDO3386476.1 AAA family ATPase [Gilvimarinus sp. SDUM040013]
MYHQYFGLKEPAFSIAVNPRYLYMSEQHKEALAHLLYGVTGGGFVLLTGEVGTGKTTIIRSLLEQLPEHTDLAMVFNPMAEVPEMLQMICDELGAEYDRAAPSVKKLTDTLHRYLLENHSRNRHTVLLIDEAQLLSPEALEQIRLLTNLETNTEKLLQIILVGQPELNRLLAQPRLRQLSQRITARFHLNPLSLAETRAYIGHRLQVAGLSGANNPFPDAIVRKIHSYSGGIPRRINILCERALVGLYGHNKERVDGKILSLARREVSGSSEGARHDFSGLWRWLSLALALVAVLSVALLLWQQTVDNDLETTPPSAEQRIPEKQSPDRQSPGQQLAGVGSPPQQAIVGGTQKAPGYLIRRLSDAQAQLAGYSGFDNPLTCFTSGSDAAICEVEHYDTWQQLAELNRPALLSVITPDKFHAYVLVVGLTSSQALVIDRDGTQHSVALAELGALWRGQTIYLWRRPPGYQKGASVGLGDSGPLVHWLSNAFARIDEQQRPLTDDRFNSALAARLKIFQRNSGLTVDGILGQQTILRLNERLGIDTTLMVEGDW